MSTQDHLPEGVSSFNLIDRKKLADWLCENRHHPHAQDIIPQLEHALDIFARAQRLLRDGKPISLSQIFENDLTPVELQEYISGKYDSLTSQEQTERSVFLDAIYSQEFSRTDAKDYARCTIAERDGRITEQDKMILESLREKATEEDRKGKEEMRNILGAKVGKNYSQLAIKVSKLTQGVIKKAQRDK